MKNNIYKKGDNLIIEIPLIEKRYNPYSEEESGEMDNICALIYKDKSGNDEMGFAKYIDLDYKGKSDQWTSIFYEYWGDKKEFEELCKKLNIDIIYE